MTDDRNGRDDHEAGGTSHGKEPDQDRLLDHEYDGIREFDNRLPNWWLYTLYGAIIFSIGYWIIFHTLGAVPLPRGRYELEMIAAAEDQLKRMEGQEISNETLSLMATVPDRVQKGKQLFEQFCVVCHGNQGEGNVGPNLTDNYWLHGYQPLDILGTVTNGVPEKGMAAWGDQLGPVRVQSVVSYVLTLLGTNVKGKDPQGEFVEPDSLVTLGALVPIDLPEASSESERLLASLRDPR